MPERAAAISAITSRCGRCPSSSSPSTGPCPQLIEDDPLLGRRVLEVAPDDDEIERATQLRRARPRLEQRGEALDPVQPPDRQDQRQTSPRLSKGLHPRRQIGDRGGVRSRERRRVDGRHRDALGDGADRRVADVGGEADEILQDFPPAGARQQCEPAGPVAHTLHQPGAEQQVLALVGADEAFAVERPARLALLDERVRIGREREVHGQAETAQTRSAASVATSAKRRWTASGARRRSTHLQAALELAAMGPHVAGGEVAIAAEREPLDSRAVRHLLGRRAR